MTVDELQEALAVLFDGELPEYRSHIVDELVIPMLTQARNKAIDEAVQAVVALANGNDSWHQEAYYAHKRAISMSIDAIRELKS